MTCRHTFLLHITFRELYKKQTKKHCICLKKNRLKNRENRLSQLTNDVIINNLRISG